MKQTAIPGIPKKSVAGKGKVDENIVARLTDFNKRIIESAPISIMTLDKNGFITFTNGNFKNLSGVSAPLYKCIYDMPFFIRERLVSHYKKVLADGTPFTRDNCHSKNSAGEEKYINIVVAPLKDGNGNIDGALSIATDVTDATMARLELDELNRSLKERVLRKTKQLQQLNDKLKESLRLKSQFISDASHELRTPLAIAKLNLELFKDRIPDGEEESKKTISAIDGEISRIADILSDITFFTAIDEEIVEKMAIEKIDLNKFIVTLAERIKSLADKKNISIKFVKTKANLEIEGDRIKLEKLFLNIIGNAIKYGKKSGWVKIATVLDSRNRSVGIVIEDNGVGVSEKDLPHIFHRFYRADSSKDTGEGGFGLGLTISKWIVEQHKGSVSVKSTAGKGSIFTINLPIEQSRV